MPNLQEAFDAGFEAVKKYVDAEMASITMRIAQLEARKPEKGEKGESGEKGKDGEKGEQGPPGQAGPEGKAGERGDPGSPGEKGEVGPAGPEGAPGRDGRDGQPGRDGKDGEKGKDGLNGKDGANGIDGKDGLGFDDLNVEYDGERSFKLVFAQGERRKEFQFVLPIVLDRGVWKQGEYKRGDATTWGGSLWIAQKDTDTKPDTPNSDWRLSAKRGRDGKDGKNGVDGKVGPEGRAGRDFTQNMARL